MVKRKGTIYQGDIGARLVLFVVDKDGDAHTGIPSALVKQIKVTTPSGDEKTFTAEFATSPYGLGDGTDGGIQYVTVNAADLPEGGVYEVRGYIEFDATNKRHTQPTTLYVGSV